jgi:hypothetical protein
MPPANDGGTLRFSRGGDMSAGKQKKIKYTARFFKAIARDWFHLSCCRTATGL